MRRPPEENRRTLDPLAIGLAVAATSLPMVGDSNTARLFWMGGLAVIFALGRLRSTGPRSIYLSNLLAPGCLFLFGVAAVVLGTTPFAPGGGHPLWLLVSRGGGAAIDLEADGVGLMEIIGLGLTFLAALEMGRRRATARSLADAVIALGVVMALLSVASRLLRLGGIGHATLGLFSDFGVQTAFLGVVAILASERLSPARRLSASVSGAARSEIDRARSIYLPGCALALCLIGLALGPFTSLMIVATMVGLLFAWGALAGGRRRGVSRRVLTVLVPTIAGLALTIAILVADAASDTPLSRLSRSAHWAAVQASPWLGYGLGAQAEVAKLIMTRLNLSALAAFPTPNAAYVVWLEQGGFLVTGAMSASLVWITATILFQSLYGRRLDGLMRAVVCASLFLGLYGLIDAAPSMFVVETIWMAVLGLGFGAATTDR